MAEQGLAMESAQFMLPYFSISLRTGGPQLNVNIWRSSGKHWSAMETLLEMCSSRNHLDIRLQMINAFTNPFFQHFLCDLEGMLLGCGVRVELG